VPARPVWYGKLDSVIAALEALDRDFVDRATVEFLLGVGRRRAQQIMAPCITDRVGANGLADRRALIDRLRRLACGDERMYEIERRRRVATVLETLWKQRRDQPQLLVEAPLQIVGRKFADLPAGVVLTAGRITIEFDAPQEALEKLLALAMAIGNDFETFEKRVNVRPVVGRCGGP
jgi:hypothetical protein